VRAPAAGAEADGGALQPRIEALRGLAAVLVMLHHFSYPTDAALTGGWLHFLHTGVDLFFVITGYLFAAHLLGERREAPGPFLVRRAFRLWPLYALSLAVAVAREWGRRDGVLEAAAWHLGFVHTLPVFDLAQIGFFSQLYWTLPVEAMFYGLVAIVLLLPARPGSASRRFAVFGGLALAGWLISVFALAPSDSERWVVWQAQLPALLLPFWFGMAAHVARKRLETAPALRRALALVGAATLVLAWAWYRQLTEGQLTARPFGAFNLVCAAGWACLFAAFVHTPAALPPRATTLALHLGAWSYGIYLFHEWALKAALRLAAAWPAAAQVVLAILLAAAVAALLHRTVEAPLRRIGRRWASALAAAQDRQQQR
jgi:exopolysaccharide production protein ExoZ